MVTTVMSRATRWVQQSTKNHQVSIALMVTAVMSRATRWVQQSTMSHRLYDMNAVMQGETPLGFGFFAGISMMKVGATRRVQQSTPHTALMFYNLDALV